MSRTAIAEDLVWVELTDPLLLDHLSKGKYVYDAMGDPWVKQSNGHWELEDEQEHTVLASNQLMHVWGPLRTKLSNTGEIHASLAEAIAEQYPEYTAQEELKDRLNSQLKGRNPGAPINWRGL
jgi:uncharacterized protein HemY